MVIDPGFAMTLRSFDVRNEHPRSINPIIGTNKNRSVPTRNPTESHRIMQESDKKTVGIPVENRQSDPQCQNPVGHQHQDTAKTKCRTNEKPTIGKQPNPTG
jgi:hypothetical protein